MFDVPPAPPHYPSSIIHHRWVSLALLAWLILVEMSTQAWYRWHERGLGSTMQWSLRADPAIPGFTKVKIPNSVSAQFRADESTEVRWQDGAGNPWQLYYFRWLPARSLKKRVSVQLAKTHGPEKCLPRSGMILKASLGTIMV